MPRTPTGFSRASAFATAGTTPCTGHHAGAALALRGAAGSRRPRLRRGFTILELLIVIGILLALGGIVLYNLSGQSDKANLGIQRSQLQMIKKAVEMFRVDVRRLPTEEEGLAALWDKTVLDEEVAKLWQGPYMDQPIRVDLWGRELKYIPTDEVAYGFDIVSWGPDGQENTDDDISLAAGAQTDDGMGGSMSGGGR